MQLLALFDLDNTLVDRRAAFTVWAEEFVTDHDLDADALSWLMDADARGSGTKGPLFQSIQHKFALEQSAADLWQQYRERMPDLVRCRPGDHDSLRRLRSAGWRIGIVTNGMTDNQRGKIQRTGLDLLVDAWSISEEIGIRKPDPRIFHRTIQRCGASTQCGGWMIGDDPVLDIVGGHSAGLRTIWLQTQSPTSSFEDAAPDYTVASVPQAVDLLLMSA